MDTQIIASPALPAWSNLQATASGIQSTSSNQETDYSITPAQDFLDMLDSEVDSGNAAETTAVMDDDSPERPKMYPHKLY